MSERAGRSERRRARRVIVVGSGVSGMSTALALCRARVPVLLLSRAPALRAPSVSDREGFAVARGESPGDDSFDHFRETIVAGDWAAQQPPVRAMTAAAPRLLSELERAGVPFDRSVEGRIARDPVAGSGVSRAARAGSCTAQQVLRALDAQVLCCERQSATDARGAAVPGEPLLLRLVPWSFVALVRDDNGVCVGVVARDLGSGKIRAFVGDAVCLASGGYGGLMGRSTASPLADGAAIAHAFRQGAALANPELFAWQPTALPGPDKPRALPELVRALGARVWVAKDPRAGEPTSDKERDHCLERAFPEQQGLGRADVAARVVWRAEQRVADAGANVMLDPSGLGAAELERLDDLFAALARWGESPRGPWPVVAAAEASLGGLWVDYEACKDGELSLDSPRNQATNLSGLYAAGGAEYQFHGAARLTGNALPASLFGGELAARGISAYRDALARSAFDLPSSIFERAETAAQEAHDARVREPGADGENPFLLRDRIGELLWASCGIEREADALDALAAELGELGELVSRASGSAGPAHDLALRLPDLLLLAQAVAIGARARRECRGGHYEPALDPKRSQAAPERGAAKTTLLSCDADGAVHTVDALEYDCAGRTVRVDRGVDASLLDQSSGT